MGKAQGKREKLKIRAAFTVSAPAFLPAALLLALCIAYSCKTPASRVAVFGGADGSSPAQTQLKPVVMLSFQAVNGLYGQASALVAYSSKDTVLLLTNAHVAMDIAGGLRITSDGVRIDTDASSISFETRYDQAWTGNGEDEEAVGHDQGGIILRGKDVAQHFTAAKFAANGLAVNDRLIVTGYGPDQYGRSQVRRYGLNRVSELIGSHRVIVIYGPVDSSRCASLLCFASSKDKALTAPGDSGSPAFNSHWEVVAFTEGGNAHTAKGNMSVLVNIHSGTTSFYSDLMAEVGGSFTAGGYQGEQPLLPRGVNVNADSAGDLAGLKVGEVLADDGSVYADADIGPRIRQARPADDPNAPRSGDDTTAKSDGAKRGEPARARASGR